jgi:bifunctional non-homologous end joining protein LigD
MARRPAQRSLARYRDKRDFTRTPEPAGAADSGPDGDAPRFVVQRHRARRLHYDFRLEIDGVLVSWAVPKGLTLDPKPRHLAVHVEDHPIDYFDFEGVIPKGQYGGGDVIVWDRGTWELHEADDAAAALDAGELHVQLHGDKLRGRFVLIRTDRRGQGRDAHREQWLVLHKRDEFAEPGWDPEDHPRSVLTGRDNDAVAAERDRVWTSEGEIGHAPVTTVTPVSDDELAALDALPGTGGPWDVAGRELALTNLDKVLFPGRDGGAPVTKRDLVRYHAVMAPWILPYLVDRPLNLHRYPDGVDRKGFWQKQAPSYTPDWIERWTNPEADDDESRDHLVVAETAALAWLANHAAVELHPWTSHRPDVHHPTYALVDLDPGESTTWDELLTLARLHRTALEHLQVRGYPKTTGRRGLQIWIPIEPGPTFDETREWVHQLSRAVAGVVGDLVSDKWETKARAGRARLDYTQNAINKTLVAPYSVRAGAGAPVSVPISWDELDDRDLRSDRWDVRSAPTRVAEQGDPMALMLSDAQHLPPLV